MRETERSEQELWRRLDWNDVRTFLAVAETGSLNAAARLLGMTQPTISRRMEEFEYRLKARLFERTPRGVTLTEAGLEVRELARGMARLGGSIMREVAGDDHSTAGRVRLATTDGVAAFLLAPQVPRFQMQNPHIHLEIDCSLPSSGSLEAEPDLFLELSDTCPSDLVSIPVATLHYALFASRDYLDLYGTPKTLAELTEHRTVKYLNRRDHKGVWSPKALAISALADMHLISDSSATTFQAVRAGAGVCSLPTYVTTIAPELVMLDLEPWGHTVLFLRHHAAIAHQRRVSRVKEWLLEIFDPAEQPWFREEFIHPRDFEAARVGRSGVTRLRVPTRIAG